MAHQTRYELPESLAETNLLLALQEHYGAELVLDQELRRIYYDTFDWRLYGNGYLLWTEAGRDYQCLHLSSLTGEHLCTCPHYQQTPGWGHELPEGGIRKLLRKPLGIRRLLPCLQVYGRQQSAYHYDAQRKLLGRTFLEHLQVATLETPWQALPPQLCCVPLRGYEQALRKLDNDLRHSYGLQPLQQDPLYQGLAYLNRQPGSYSSKYRFQVTAAEPAAAALQQLLAQLLNIIEINRPGACDQWDSEFLHDLRVACRRSRSALNLFKGAWHKEVRTPLARQLSWLQKVTGPARDLDVHLLTFDQHQQQLPEAWQPALEPLRHLLQEQQDQAYANLWQELIGQNYQAFYEQSQAVLQQSWQQLAGNKGQQPFKAYGQRQLYKTWHSVLQQGRAITAASPDAELHSLRKNCKKLRYLLEFLAPVLSSRKGTKAIKDLKGLQDYLGHFQDLCVQQESLAAQARQLREADGEAATLLAMGMLLEQLRQEQYRVRQDFTQVFDAFASGKSYQRLEELCAEE